MVTKAQQKKLDDAKREAFLKSLLGHVVTAILAGYALWQDNPAIGVSALVFGVGIPLLRNWQDGKYKGYGK